jgi:enoyl-CoA hydratase
MYSTLLTELSNGILTVTINRPDKLNALNQTVMKELDEVVAEIYSNKEIRSAILTGAGLKAFVAGADISEFIGLNKQDGQALSAKGQGIFARIENSPKPIVAAVNGFALGGGCELAMACHFRLCSANARFGQPEVNLGLIPGYGGTQRLTLLIGKGRALELMLTGEMIGGEEALRLGLVNYMVPQEELLVKTRSLLTLIGEKAPIAVAKTIFCVNIAGAAAKVDGGTGEWNDSGAMGGGGNASDGEWVQEASEATGATGVAFSEAGDRMGNGFVQEQKAFGECIDTEDAQEGAKAFLEKRKPLFKGK